MQKLVVNIRFFTIEIDAATKTAVVFGQQLFHTTAASFRIECNESISTYTYNADDDDKNIYYTHWHKLSEHGIISM